MVKGYSRERLLEAIKGSGGITLTVAQRLGCDWVTAKRYIEKWESTKEAFRSENEQILDVAESVLSRNIRLAYRQQEDTGLPVDSGDAKWLLARKGKRRGYADKQEIEYGGTGEGGAIPIRLYTDDSIVILHDDDDDRD